MSLIPLVSILGLIFTVPEAVQAVPNGGYARPEVLIQPEELKALVDKKDPNIRIIPGVIWIEWTETLVGEGPYKGYWKSAEEIKRVFSAKGATPEKEIFIY